MDVNIKMQPKPFLFLDRDGTLIEDKGYTYKTEDLKFISGIEDALSQLQQKFSLVIVTNQSGISRGYYTLEQFHQFNHYFLNELSQKKVNISKVLFCPHLPDDNCLCRKPKTKLITDYLQESNQILDTKKSFVIGDKIEDLELAHNLGIDGILVRTGKGGINKTTKLQPIYFAEDLPAAARYLLKNVVTN